MAEDVNVLVRRTMTKKQYKEYLKKSRSVVTKYFNTGSRTMKSSKDYDRQAIKLECQKIMKEMKEREV